MQLTLRWKNGIKINIRDGVRIEIEIEIGIGIRSKQVYNSSIKISLAVIM